jgi:hypothetical protein
VRGARVCLLKPASDANQNAFATVAGDDLHADGQALRCPPQRELKACWPLVLNGGVNGTNWPTRRIGDIG